MKRLAPLFLTVQLIHAQADPLQLPDLLQQALTHHPSLRGQQERWGAARAGVDAALWQYWPTPSISLEQASATKRDVTYQGSNKVAFLRLQQPLWSGGRLSGNLSHARAAALIAEAEYREAAQQIALRVVQAWSEALVAERKLSSYQASRRIHQRLLDLVQRRHAEGASALADVALARSRLSQLDSKWQTVQAQLDMALDKLRLLTGLTSVDTLGTTATDFPMPQRAPTLAALLQAARDQSPALSKAQAQIDTAQADAEVAYAALSPDIYFRIERQYGNFSLADQPPVNRAFVGLSTALGGGLSSLSGIEAAQARSLAAAEDLQTQQIALDEQVRTDFTLAQSTQSRRSALESVKQTAAQVLDSYERQFLEGRKQWQDLLNAAREQAQSEAQLADTRGAEQLANWRLAVLSRSLDDILSDFRFQDTTLPTSPTPSINSPQP